MSQKTAITKRFRVRDSVTNPALIEDAEGDFVRYEDYATLFGKWIGAEKMSSNRAMELSRLREENEKLTKIADSLLKEIASG